MYNNPERNSEVDENLLPGDHNVTGHIGNQSDFFVCRHQSTAAALKKHHDDYKGMINSGIVNKTKSGQGDTDAPSEIERLVEAEANSRKVVADDDNWGELEEAVRLRMYSNPTGNNIISYVRGDIGLYYMWVLFEMHNLTRFINMRVAPEESCTSTGATRSAVDAGRVSKRGTKRAKPADEKTETLKACVAALSTTLKELGSASTTTATDSLVDPELARWAEKEKKLQEVNIAHAQANQETRRPSTLTRNPSRSLARGLRATPMWTGSRNISLVCVASKPRGLRGFCRRQNHFVIRKLDPVVNAPVVQAQAAGCNKRPAAVEHAQRPPENAPSCEELSERLLDWHPVRRVLEVEVRVAGTNARGNQAGAVPVSIVAREVELRR